MEIGEVVVILAVGALVEFALPLLYRNWRRRLEQKVPATIWRRIPLALGYMLLRLLPLIGFFLAALAMGAAFRPDKIATLIAVALINAHVVSAVVCLIPLFVFDPPAPGLRFSKLSDNAARDIYNTIATIIGVAAYGYFTAVAMGAAGLPNHI